MNVSYRSSPFKVIGVAIQYELPLSFTKPALMKKKTLHKILILKKIQKDHHNHDSEKVCNTKMCALLNTRYQSSFFFWTPSSFQSSSRVYDRSCVRFRFLLPQEIFWFIPL